MSNLVLPTSDAGVAGMTSLVAAILLAYEGDA